jgi:hypothetical protein
LFRYQAMLFSAQPAPDRDATVLRCVRQSINTPVVAISELPVGPATAAIALHDGAQAESVFLTLAVRNERTRGVVFFGSRQAAESDAASHSAEAVLFLAEGMGFLFDEAWLEAENSGAERIWKAFASAAQPNPSTPTRSTETATQSGPEFLLTKFRRALPWNSQSLGRSGTDSAAWAAAELRAEDEIKVLESQLAHRGEG